MNTFINRFLYQLRLLVRTVNRNKMFVQMKPLFIGCFIFILFGLLGSLFSVARNKFTGTSSSDSKLEVGEIPDNIKEISKSDPMRGNKDAKYSLIEYSDYECPFCKDFHISLKKLIDENNDFNWVYRNYPLPFHPGAKDKARAATCVFTEKGDDAFWKFSDVLFDDQALAVTELSELAEKHGLSKGDLESCLKDVDDKKLAEIYDEATKIGITGTPSTVILNTDNNKAVLVVGAVPVEELLNKAKSLD